jgi:hypothetical protein
VRQFFSPRFWLTLLALGGLVVLLTAVFHDPATSTGVVSPQPDPDAERHIDLVSWVYAITPAPEFRMKNGVTTADIALQLDGTRTMVIKAGTRGEISCPSLEVLAQCTVAADLLGDGVLWFSIVPGMPGPTVRLPGVTELLDNGWVRLANDWVLRRASIVDRSCPDETTSLSDFVDTYGDDATSTFNFESQKIVKVSCPRVSATTTTSTTIAVAPIVTNTVLTGG